MIPCIAAMVFTVPCDTGESHSMTIIACPPRELRFTWKVAMFIPRFASTAETIDMLPG